MDNRLEQTAEAILTNLASALEAEGIVVPSRRYVAAGDIAHDFASTDCAEQFAITWGGSFQGLVAQGGNLTNAPILCAMPLTAQFTVVLLRCVPVINALGIPPSESELDASGKAILRDAMTLAAVAIDEHLAGSLDEMNCQLVGITQLAPVGPLGGVGGTTLTLLVGLT